jgi:hypothetical protein
MNSAITLKLDENEALVLFDFLARLDDLSKSGAKMHRAEEVVLNHIEARLEKELSQPFEPNYYELLESARNKVLSNR